MRKQKGLLLLLCEFLEAVEAFLQRQQSLFHPAALPPFIANSVLGVAGGPPQKKQNWVCPEKKYIV